MPTQNDSAGPVFSSSQVPKHGRSLYLYISNTRQGYARERTLKPAGFIFSGIGGMLISDDQLPLSPEDVVRFLVNRGMVIERF